MGRLQSATGLSGAVELPPALGAATRGLRPRTGLQEDAPSAQPPKRSQLKRSSHQRKCGSSSGRIGSPDRPIAHRTGSSWKARPGPGYLGPGPGLPRPSRGIPPLPGYHVRAWVARSPVAERRPEMRRPWNITTSEACSWTDFGAHHIWPRRLPDGRTERLGPSRAAPTATSLSPGPKHRSRNFRRKLNGPKK